MLSGLSLVTKIALASLAALLAVAIVWGLYHAATAKPKAEARIATNQVSAAQASGTDAVNVVGAAGARESQSADLSRTNEEAIRNAEGSNAVVAAPVRDAGLLALCRRDSHKRDPKCLLHANP